MIFRIVFAHVFRTLSSVAQWSRNVRPEGHRTVPHVYKLRAPRRSRAGGAQSRAGGCGGFAQRALEWRPARSAVCALQHGIISAAPLGPPPGLATCHIATSLIIHAIVTRRCRTPPACQIRRAPRLRYSIDLLTSPTQHEAVTRCNVTVRRAVGHQPRPRSARTHCRCIRF